MNDRTGDAKHFFAAWWGAQGYLAGKVFAPGEPWAAVAPLLFGRARIVLCTEEVILDGW